ncbi:hypothetical protein Mapa_013487 [Marchantia paleacea]|nr:hypothetical protein Mapa_013487 [Marchantia paleacea]
MAVKNMKHSSFTGNSIRDRYVVIILTVCSTGSVLCNGILLCFQLLPGLQVDSCSDDGYSESKVFIRAGLVFRL